MKQTILAFMLVLALASCKQSDPEDVLGRQGDVVTFAGRNWDVKYSLVPVGPGPNNFLPGDCNGIYAFAYIPNAPIYPIHYKANFIRANPINTPKNPPDSVEYEWSASSEWIDYWLRNGGMTPLIGPGYGFTPPNLGWVRSWVTGSPQIDFDKCVPLLVTTNHTNTYVALP